MALRSLLLTGLVIFALALPAAAKPDAAPDTTKKQQPIHKITQSPSYLMVDPIYTTILDGDRPLGLLMIGVGLDVPDAGLREKVDKAMPALRDAYIRTLMTYTAASVRPWQQPDVGEIADRLQSVTDRILKREGARVLLAQVAMRLTH